MEKKFKPLISVFYCINSFDEVASLVQDERFQIKYVKMACSSMVKEVFILRAFEAGADAVIVFVCPEGQCRYVEGNIRAKKRIGWVKKLLDEIGLDGQRLSIFNLSINDRETAVKAIQRTLADLETLGPNPAA